MAGRTQTSGATRRLSAIRCHGEVGRWRRGIACGLDHVCGRSGARSGDHTHAARQRNVGPHVNFPSNRGGFFNEMWPDITCSWLTDGRDRDKGPDGPPHLIDFRAPPHLVAAVTCVSARCHGSCPSYRPLLVTIGPVARFLGATLCRVGFRPPAIFVRDTFLLWRPSCRAVGPGRRWT